MRMYAEDAMLYSSFKVEDYSPALVEALEYITNGPASGIQINDYELQWSSCTLDLVFV